MATRVRVVGARAFLILAAVATLSLGGVGYLALQGREAHDALCAFRADLERRADTTDEFIKELREGTRDPIPGITPADLARSVAGQRSTLDALDDLDCPTPPTLTTAGS